MDEVGLTKIDNKVLFVAELPGQLAGLHLAEGALLRLGDLRIHVVVFFWIFLQLRR